MAVIVAKSFTADKEIWKLNIIKLCRHRFMCEAYPIAKLLGNKRPELAIRNCIDQSCCKTWGELKNLFNCGSLCIFQSIPPPVHTPVHWGSNTLFINEEGVISLINSSTLPVANKFKWWFLTQTQQNEVCIFQQTEVCIFRQNEASSCERHNEVILRRSFEIDMSLQNQITQNKRNKAIVAKQHQQQQRQQRQQQPMVVRDERQRPTRKGTRGCASFKQ
ncbi:BRO-C [Helicoverpa armigera granulovirus]|uniref:BRO-C n=1 Tax=Helicoverpa armigera granulovirus TaxID=489830 RepID=A9YMQ0_9BBAC|nr:BRO-C [Helicoverpa armigera granulovirus]ABY47749.1 BRO-C [Helicoverpa armigera granulovirus]